MQVICKFRGIKIFMIYDENNPPHFNAEYGEHRCSISIEDIKLIDGTMQNKQLKMLLRWAALHLDELRDEWYLAGLDMELFEIEPLK